MAKVKIQGHASGTGIFTVTAPDSDTNRTITLPDGTGTLAFTTGDDDKLPLAGGTMTGNLVVGAITDGATNSIIINSSDGSYFHAKTENDNEVGALMFGNDTADIDGRIQYDSRRMRFFTAGTDRLEIDTSGNVGIGVSPGARFDVMTTGDNVWYIRNTDVSAQDNQIVSMYTGGYSNMVLDGATMQFKISSTERMRIDSSGQVGIGRSPTTDLDLYKSGQDVEMKIEAATASANSYFTMRNDDGKQLHMRLGGSTVGGTTWAGLTGANQASIEAQSVSSFTIGTHGTAPIIFVQARAEKMRVDSNGNVGIGTDDPVEALHVEGEFATSRQRTYQATRSHTSQAINLLTSDHTSHQSSGRWYTVKGTTCGPGNAGKEGMYEFTLRAYSGDGTGGEGNYNFAIENTSSTLYGTATNSIPTLTWSGSGGSRTLVLTVPSFMGSSGIIEVGGYSIYPLATAVTWL